MVKPRRGLLLAGAGALLLGAYLLLPSAPSVPAPPPLRRGARTASTSEIPRIALSRLDELARREKVKDIGRDPSRLPEPPAPPPPPPTMAVATPAPLPVPTGPPPPPPLNLTYLGNLQNNKGLKVAVFLTDKKVILHGREGEIVGSRVRVVKINIESVDVEDLSSGRGQRLALPRKGGLPGDSKGSAGGDAAQREARDKEPGGNSR